MVEVLAKVKQVEELAIQRVLAEEFSKVEARVFMVEQAELAKQALVVLKRELLQQFQDDPHEPKQLEWVKHQLYQSFLV